MRALDAAMSAPWAMLPDRVEELLAIAARETMPTPEALEAYRAARAERGEKLGVRDGVGILQVTGPLFKYANLFTQYSGATSYQVLMTDFQAALDNPDIGAIILNIDSPGGEANGCDELAAAIYKARGRKPITAYVSGMACSGAYWIASAADRIVVSDAAMLGSIGVVLGISDRRQADEARGITRVDFVSSQSPGKRPDIQTDAGKARVQKLVDDLATVFVGAVAKHRGVSVERVLAKFGAGGVEIGANAVSAGMADVVGQFEETLAGLAKSGTRAQRASGAIEAGRTRLAGKPGAQIAEPLSVPRSLIPADEARAMAIGAVRARYSAFSAIEERKESPALFAHLRDQTDVSAADAAKILKAARQDLITLGLVVVEDQAAVYYRSKMLAGALGTETWTVNADGSINYGTAEDIKRRSAGWSAAVNAANSHTRT